MAFSFSPAQSGSQPAQGGVSPAPAANPGDPAAIPTVPDSPFLFIQQRGKELTVNAYLQMILLLVSILSIVSALTIFIYGIYLKSAVASKKAQVDATESGFKEYPVADMKRLSDRVGAVNVLLKDYVSIRSPLRLLEDVVERQVVFNNFNLARQKTGGYVANFTATTRDYNSLIQQLEALNLQQYKKIATNSKMDKFIEDKTLTLSVQITTPVMVQGVLPDDIVFIQSPAPTPSAGTSTNTQAVNAPSGTVTAPASTTPQ